MPGKLRVIGYTAIMNLQAKKVTFVDGGRKTGNKTTRTQWRHNVGVRYLYARGPVFGISCKKPSGSAQHDSWRSLVALPVVPVQFGPVCLWVHIWTICRVPSQCVGHKHIISQCVLHTFYGHCVIAIMSTHTGNIRNNQSDYRRQFI